MQRYATVSAMSEIITAHRCTSLHHITAYHCVSDVQRSSRWHVVLSFAGYATTPVRDVMMGDVMIGVNVDANVSCAVRFEEGWELCRNSKEIK